MTDLDHVHVRKSRRRKFFAGLAAVCLALIGILALTAIYRPARMDYVEYWSSGKLIAQHLNPYSPVKVLALEEMHGFPPGRAQVMPNPPWTLFLVAPLGFFGIREGLFLWLAVTLSCIVFSVLLLNRNSKEGPLALVFAPVLACLCSGQSSPFLLLGFVAFLHLHRKRPFMAGASLLLMSIKPHLFLVFWAVLLADCLYRRSFAILWGALCAIAAATAIALCFDPHVFQHYVSVMLAYRYQGAFLPTASMLFRMLIDVRAFWLLFVPSVLAVLWGVWYYERFRQVWDWRVHGMLLMLVTIFASPYGFFSDEIVLLPSIAFALGLANRRKYSGWILMAINTAALILIASGAQLSSGWYVWTPFAWLGWFVFATHRVPYWGRKPATDPTSMREELVN